MSSSLLLFPQCFGRYVLQPSSGVYRTRDPSRNFELRPLLNPRGSPVLIPVDSIKDIQSKVTNHPNTDEGWTEVSRKKRKSPNKGEKKPVSASPVKDLGPKAVSTTEPTPVTKTAPPSSPDSEDPPASATPPATKDSAKRKPKKTTQDTPMETTTNRKRRRDSGEGASKKMCSGPSHHKVGPSDSSSETQLPPQPAPLQLLPPPPLPSPPPPPPQYCYLQHAPPVQPPQQVLQPPQPPQQMDYHSSQQKPDPHNRLFSKNSFPNSPVRIKSPSIGSVL